MTLRIHARKEGFADGYGPSGEIDPVKLAEERDPLETQPQREFPGLRGYRGFEHGGEHGEGADEGRQRLVEFARPSGVARQRPGFARLHEPVGCAGQIHRGGEALVEAVPLEPPPVRRQRMADLLGESIGGGVGDRAPPVPLHHGQAAVGEVAEDVAQLVITGQEAVRRVRCVVAGGHLPHQVPADGVGPVQLPEVERVHHVAQRLGHLGIAHDPPAVREDLAGQGQARAHQQRRPVDRVRGENVLAHEVHVAGPPRRAARVAEAAAVAGGVGFDGPGGRDVVGQCVHPHVGHLVGVPGQRDAPVDARARAGDRQVAEPLRKEAENLVAARGGHDPLRVVLDVPDQPVAEVAHAEEVVFFADTLDRSARDRVHAVGPDLLFGEVAFLADGVPPRVLGLVDVALVVQTFQ